MKLQHWFRRFSAKIYATLIHGHWRTICITTLLFIVAAIAVMPLFKLDTSLLAELPASGPLHDIGKVSAEFNSNGSILVSLPVDDPYSLPTFARLQQISAALIANKDVWSVTSPTNISDLERNGDSVAQVPLAPDPDTARRHLSRSPLLQSLFLSPDGKHWSFWLTPFVQADQKIWLQKIEAFHRENPDVLISGTAYLTARLKENMGNNFVTLLVIAFVVLFICYLLLLRSVQLAGLLWVASAVPTLLLCALFPVTGQGLRIYTMLAPFLTLALSTSYVSHLFYGWLFLGRNLRRTFHSRGPVVMLDAMTALLGFATLFLSPLKDLQTLGAFIIAGICLSMLVAFFPFMAVLERWGCKISLTAGAHLFKDRLKVSIVRRRWFVLACVVAVVSLVAIIPGLSRLSLGYEYTDNFNPWDQSGADLRKIQDVYGGLSELILIVDSGSEYGLTQMSVFTSITKVCDSARLLPGVSQVYGYQDLVGEVLARYDGIAGSRMATSDAEVAEALELGGSLIAGQPGGAMVDTAWSKARLGIRLKPQLGHQETLALVTAISTKLDQAGLAGKYRWGGDVYLQAMLDVGVIREQTISLCLLFGGYALFLMIVFGSVRKGLVALIAPIFSSVIAIGCIGLLGWRLNQVLFLSLTMVAAISVDGAIMCLMIPSNKASRRAVRDANILIGTVIAILTGSSIFIIVQTSIVGCIGLAVSTFVILFVIDYARKLLDQRLDRRQIQNE